MVTKFLGWNVQRILEFLYMIIKLSYAFKHIKKVLSVIPQTLTFILIWQPWMEIGGGNVAPTYPSSYLISFQENCHWHLAQKKNNLRSNFFNFRHNSFYGKIFFQSNIRNFTVYSKLVLYNLVKILSNVVFFS